MSAALTVSRTLPDRATAAAVETPAHGLRWLLLPVFLLGAWFTADLLAPFQAEYWTLSTIAALACTVLLMRLRSLSVGSLPIWIMLGAFVLGYFVKFYVLLTIAAAPSAVSYFAIPQDRLVFSASPQRALEAFQIGVTGFVVFCLVFAAVPHPSGPNWGPHRTVRVEDVASRVRTMTITAAVLLGLTTAVALVLGVLVLGIADEALPFRLVGVLFYTRTIGIVILTLAVLQLGLNTGARNWTRAGVLLLLAYAVTDMLVRSTRGSVVMVAIALALMMVVVHGRIGKSARRAFGVLFVLALLLYPVITQYRLLRTETEQGAELFVEALRYATRDATVVDIFWTGAASFLTRFIGIDSLLFLTERETWLGVDGVAALHARGSTVAGYFTNTVVGIPVTRAHSEAPSLLGWFAITGGWWGLTVGFAVFLALSWWLWTAIWNSTLLLKPVAQVQFLLMWLTLSSEGTFDSVLLSLPLIALAILGLNALLRVHSRDASGSLVDPWQRAARFQ